MYVWHVIKKNLMLFQLGSMYSGKAHTEHAPNARKVGHNFAEFAILTPAYWVPRNVGMYIFM